jgi:hypothetical protein
MRGVVLHVSFVPILPSPVLVIQALTVKTFRSDLSSKLAGGRFVPMHRCSLNVVYKMNVSVSMNIFILCILILNNSQCLFDHPILFTLRTKLL